MQTLTGQFQIQDWQETTQSEYELGKRNLAMVKLAYSGDVEGNSELQYLLSYQTDGSADFVGFETIQASIKSTIGSLVLKHTGRFEAGVASSQFEVVQSSLEDTPIGAKGSFTSGENGLAQYTITR